MRWGAWVVVALAVLPLAPAGANLLYDLHAALASPTPIRIHGVLGPAGDQASSTAYLDLSETGSLGRLLKVDQAVLRVYRHVDREVGLEVDGVGWWQPDSPYVATRAALDSVKLNPGASVLVTDLHRHAVEASGARCDLMQAEAGSSDVFPRGGEETWFGEGRLVDFPRDGLLRAVCTASAFSATSDPAMPDFRYFFYGLDLHLLSKEHDRLIRTGTFEEPDPNGLPVTRQVTQILEVFARTRGGKAEFHVASPRSIEMTSREFRAVGAFEASDQTGELQWGDVRARGPLEPIVAFGDFHLASGDAVEVEGRTVDGPPVRPSSVVPGASPWSAASAWVAGSAAFLGLLYLLFSRLSPDQALEHPRRVRILECVGAAPGIATLALAKQLGLPWVKTVHHVRVLERTGHLRVRRVGGRTALFRTGAVPREAEESTALLRRPALRRVFDAIRQNPGCDQGALALAVGLQQSGVSKALRRLQSAGLVAVRREGARNRYEAVGPVDPQA